MHSGHDSIKVGSAQVRSYYYGRDCAETRVESVSRCSNNSITFYSTQYNCNMYYYYVAVLENHGTLPGMASGTHPKLLICKDAFLALLSYSSTTVVGTYICTLLQLTCHSGRGIIGTGTTTCTSYKRLNRTSTMYLTLYGCFRNTETLNTNTIERLTD